MGVDLGDTFIWTHKQTTSDHQADPHYDATGNWVCFKCRTKVTLIPHPTSEEGSEVKKEEKID